MYSTQHSAHKNRLDSPATQFDITGQVFDRARATPNAPAVRSADDHLSYSALTARSNELGIRLQQAGVARGDLVALCLPRSSDLIVAALAILALGATYVALDPDQPHQRLDFMVADCGAGVAVAYPSMVDTLSGTVDVVSPCTSPSATPSASMSHTVPAPGDLAYVVYTSGSTGKPKGVMVEHAGLLNLVDWHRNTFDLTASDRTTLIANPGFDAGAWEIWPTLCAGACLHVPEAALKTDPVRLRDWMIAENITVAFLPTPLAETLVELPWPPTAALRYLLTGGDVLRHLPPPGLPFELVNNYGVSEATVVSTSGTVAAQSDSVHAPSIGTPIDGVELRVVDDVGKPVPPGSIGELVICGVSVARGYLGLPRLTAQRFVSDPLDSAVRAYRTGDVVRMDDNGSVDFLGRVDDQVQIRGFRVEIGEIGDALRACTEVRTCAVVPIEGSGDPRLALFVVFQQDSNMGTVDLQHYLAQRLPDFMVPDTVVAVTELPTTAHGKIDRTALRSLPPPDRGDRIEDRPLTTVEATLLDMVAERLKTTKIGVDDNFFLLGGHSMLGAQLIIEISRIYGVEMTLLDLFDHPSVAQMAVEIERLLVQQIAEMSAESLTNAVDMDGGIS
ncbi:non-ribosomal peptide synthetase [Rhodococcoides yunnanense]|uniref:non-ribosomal peptide synthetase n=1 Tax=Rhodococcoides yunnanense TaxID=278209 RepID=UPI000935548B|nr:non-ribosomal peptide synthetase [Rhodococcus yunnanensis]